MNSTRICVCTLLVIVGLLVWGAYARGAENLAVLLAVGGGFGISFFADSNNDNGVLICVILALVGVVFAFAGAGFLAAGALFVAAIIAAAAAGIGLA